MNRIKHRFNFLFVLPLLLATLASCNSSGEYIEHEGTICFSYWTFSFGTKYEKLPQVNKLTFESIEDWVGRDNNHVYFKSTLVKGADPATIKVKKYPLIYDKKDYYYKGVPLHVASVKNFEVIKWKEEDLWAIDGKYAFYDTIRIEPKDIKSFKLIHQDAAVDSEHVYRYGKILPEADPATYVEEWKGFYNRDKSHIWYMGELLKDVDYESFVVDKDGARDKRGPIYKGERITEEQWLEIKKRRENLAE